MKMREMMNTNVQTVRPFELATRAFEKMSRRRFRHLPVTESGGKLVGIVSDRDLRNISILFERQPESPDDYMILGPVKVEDIMTRKLITLSPDDDVRRAANLFQTGRLSCLPVEEDGRLVGILTTTDLLKLLHKFLRTVEEVTKA